MKKPVLLFLFLYQMITGLAQENKEFSLFDKHRQMLGFTAGGGMGSDILLITTELRYGYFMKDKLLIGAELNPVHWGKEYNSLSGGAFLRYCMLKKPVSPFIELNSNAGYYFLKTEDRNDKGMLFNTGADVGVELLFKKFGFEIYTGLQFNSFKDFHKYSMINNPHLNMGFRFNYHF